MDKDNLYKNVKKRTKEASSNLLSISEFITITGNHKKFLEAGGKGGTWETISVGEHIIMGIYTKITSHSTSSPIAPVPNDYQALLSFFNLANIELKNIDLPYANCSQVFAEKKDWSNADLEGSLFVDSILNGSIFKNAILNRVDFSRSDMVNCNFQGANLKHADFERCNLTGANFKGAIIDDRTSFKDAILEGAIFD